MAVTCPSEFTRLWQGGLEGDGVIKTYVKILALLALLAVVPCAAEIITVDDDGPADFNNIQAAINDANDGDIVIVALGTYTGPGNRDIDFLGKAITVRSTDPNDQDIVAVTIIDCGGTEEDLHRGFYFHSGEGQNSVLDGFTITNGCAHKGGAILCHYSSSPTIINCVIQDNISTYIYDVNGTPGPMVILQDGGGIYCYESSPIIKKCCFIENTATAGGGAIFSGDGNTYVDSCVFRGNRAGISGGAIGGWQTDAVITGCTITNNVANQGGGVYCWAGAMIISNSTISNNRAEGGNVGVGFNKGGGIHCFSLADTIITNCIITGNIAEFGGGIFAGHRCHPVIANCTFSGNTATTAGGAVLCGETSYPSVVNSTLWGNNAIDGAEIAMNTIDWGSSLSISYSDMRGGKAGVAGGNSLGAHLYWGPGNIDIDPCFVEPGFWDVNGTPSDPNDDFWVDGDYHLKSEGWRWDTEHGRWTYDDVTSRCIDAGNPGSPLNDELLSVPPDPDNEWGQNLRINMGAFGGTAEASIPPYDWALLSDVTNDGISDLSDLDILSSLWLNTGEQLYADFNRDGIIDLFDFALLAQDWLEQTTWY